MKTKILSLLRNSKEYISGQDLCHLLSVSRTTVWKIMNQLKEEGYEIEAIQNKGYKIKSYPDIVTESELKSLLTTKWIGNQIKCYEETGSTNADAKQFAEAGAPNGLLVVSNTQLSGRGRRGRQWDSPSGTSISMTVLLKPDFSPLCASMLTLVMALSVVKGVEAVTSLDCEIKWPNDILIHGKKVCGILTEMSAELDYIHYVVIGVGINANQEVIPEELKEIATSFILEWGHKVQRGEVMAAILKYFEIYYDLFLQTHDMSLLQEEYMKYLVNRQKQVKVLDPKQEYTGIAKGINEKGELLVEKEDGTLVNVYAGEVSVRGMNGYI